MGRLLIILVSLCTSRQYTSSDTHNDQNGPTLQFDPGHGQCHRYHGLYHVGGAVTRAKWAVLPECYHFSENLLYIVA